MYELSLCSSNFLVLTVLPSVKSERISPKAPLFAWHSRNYWAVFLFARWLASFWFVFYFSHTLFDVCTACMPRLFASLALGALTRLSNTCVQCSQTQEHIFVCNFGTRHETIKWIFTWNLKKAPKKQNKQNWKNRAFVLVNFLNEISRTQCGIEANNEHHVEEFTFFSEFENFNVC